MLRGLILLVTHGGMLVVGFVLGIYFLPILTEPEAPDEAALKASSQSALYSSDFSRELKGSDFLHWGEGTVSINADKITHMGTMAPGPDYKLYLVPEFVEDEEQFLKLKDSSAQIGDVKTFNGFIVDVPEGVSVDDYTTVLVWCEAFGEFITAAKYR
jgi:hypothetical protein